MPGVFGLVAMEGLSMGTVDTLDTRTSLSLGRTWFFSGPRTEGSQILRGKRPFSWHLDTDS